MGTNWNEWFKCKHPAALSQVVLLECIWTDCPVEVQDEAKKIWRNRDYGNDYYYHKWDWSEDKDRYPVIYNYLVKQNIESPTHVLIHFWW